jgi:hypothetical protein
LGLGNGGISDRAFHGWFNDIPVGFWTEYGKWTRAVWKALGEGNNLEDALIYAVDHTTIGPNYPSNNFRLKGQGFIWEIYLTQY